MTPAQGANAPGGTTAVEDLPPFVLLHGGRHGGWCWRRVTPLLREAGHEVYELTLTGLGDRSHLMRPDIGLETHVQDVVSLFRFEDIRDAIFVAHSYGGMVAGGAMESIHDRVRRLVLLDAHLPLTGESVFDLVLPGKADEMRELANAEGQGWYIPPSDASYYGVTNQADIAWVNSKTTAQPLKTYQDPIGTTDRAWAHSCTFIECTPSSITPELLARTRERKTGDERFRYRTIDTPHDAMVTSPGPLAKLLLEAAEEER